MRMHIWPPMQRQDEQWWELDVLLQKEEDDCIMIHKDSVNFNFGRCLRHLTYWLWLPLLTFTCLAIAFLSHDLDAACTVHAFNPHFLSVTTCTNIYSSPYSNMCMHDVLFCVICYWSLILWVESAIVPITCMLRGRICYCIHIANDQLNTSGQPNTYDLQVSGIISVSSSYLFKNLDGYGMCSNKRWSS